MGIDKDPTLLHTVKSPETLLSELREKIQTCERVRVRLIDMLYNLVRSEDRNEANSHKEQLLRGFALDFEVRALHPARLYEDDILQKQRTTEDVPKVIQQLNEDLQNAERMFGVRY